MHERIMTGYQALLYPFLYLFFRFSTLSGRFVFPMWQSVTLPNPLCQPALTLLNHPVQKTSILVFPLSFLLHSSLDYSSVYIERPACCSRCSRSCRRNIFSFNRINTTVLIIQIRYHHAFSNYESFTICTRITNVVDSSLGCGITYFFLLWNNGACHLQTACLEMETRRLLFHLFRWMLRLIGSKGGV